MLPIMAIMVTGPLTQLLIQLLTRLLHDSVTVPKEFVWALVPQTSSNGFFVQSAPIVISKIWSQCKELELSTS